jgi:lipopolysaccharide transport system permease protein
MIIRELISYRELLYYFTWREFKVRYKQTLVGVLWVVFQPLVFALIINFTLLRGRTFDFGSATMPTILPVYIGLLFWNYFEQSLNGSSNSLVNNQAVITKVYFPRHIPSVASTLSALVDFVVASLLIVSLVIMLFVNGFGLLLATLNIRFRDIRIALPFLMRILLFATPVFYPLSFIPERFHWILFMNPATLAIEVSRALLLDTNTMPQTTDFLICGASITIALVVGMVYFRRKERVFIDII